jgi:hypothetical protein
MLAIIVKFQKYRTNPPNPTSKYRLPLGAATPTRFDLVRTMMFVGEAFRNENRFMGFVDGDDRSVIGG